MARLTFSGHESFHCKTHWLKRGYDYIYNGNNFNDNDSVIKLGVGKNMVLSIKYWMKSFGLLDEENNLTDIATYLMNPIDGRDPYFENTGTLWLLHFLLIYEDHASLYSKTFIDYHRLHNSLDRDKLQNFIKHVCFESDSTKNQYNENTVKKDILVLLHNYCNKSNDKIEDRNTLLAPLNLLREDEKSFTFNTETRNQLPADIFLFALISMFPNSNSISLDSLQDLSLLFCLNNNDLLSLVKELCSMYPNEVIYSDVAGIKEIQFRHSFQPKDILNHYYLND